jgi:hypothetical protein
MTKITNETPWDTQDLEKFLNPLVAGLGLKEVKVQTLGTMPGVKREEQSLAQVAPEHGVYFHNRNMPTEVLVVSLLSPKRADKATETLSRLSLVADIQPHEAALPEGAIAAVEHGVAQFKVWSKATTNSHEYYSCFRGQCSHKPRVQKPVLVKGNTKARIKDPVSEAEIERKLDWAQRNVDKCQEDLNEATQKRDRLQARLDKLRQKNR